MKKKVFFLICLFLYLPLSGWNSRGHMLIATIAYNQLDSHQQKSITKLLKKHPEYKIHWSSEYKNVKRDMDLGEFLMVRASVWADELGNSESPYFKYHNSKWHYINHIINFEKGHDTLIVDGRIKPNAVWASEYSKVMVEDTSLDIEVRAIYLAWLIHVVGEVHNPQHCSSLYSTTYPKGDKGGNSFYVKVDTLTMSLHGIWDGALGRGGLSNGTNIRNQAARIELSQSSSADKFDLLSFNPMNWSIESFQHSIYDAYINGSLTETPSRDEAQVLPASYLQNMKKVSEERCLIGGLRLGNTINKLELN